MKLFALIATILTMTLPTLAGAAQGTPILPNSEVTVQLNLPSRMLINGQKAVIHGAIIDLPYDDDWRKDLAPVCFIHRPWGGENSLLILEAREPAIPMKLSYSTHTYFAHQPRAFITMRPNDPVGDPGATISVYPDQPQGNRVEDHITLVATDGRPIVIDCHARYKKDSDVTAENIADAFGPAATIFVNRQVIKTKVVVPQPPPMS